MEIIKRLIKKREVVLLLFIILLLMIIGFSSTGFWQVRNLLDILLSISYVAIAAVGMSMIIITGNIDVSVGSMLAILSMTAGGLAKAGVYPVLYFIIVLVFGAALGAVNGILISRFKVPAIIVTLGMMQIHRGALILITGGYWIHDLPDSFTAIGKTQPAGIDVPIIVFVAVVIAGMWFMKYHPFSRKIYAVGSNIDAARLAGINVNRVVFIVYVITGFLVGLSTMTVATRFITIQSNAGIGFEMVVITAVVVGGTNIMGGSGKILGTFLGALLVGIISTGLTFLKVSAYWEQTFQGALILIAVALGMMQYRKKQRNFIVAGEK